MTIRADHPRPSSAPFLARVSSLLLCQILIVPAFGGCTSSIHNISYTSGHLKPDPLRRDMVLDVVIGLEVFKDYRLTRPENDPLFTDKNELRWGDGVVCVNAEEGYAPGSVVTQATAVVANYIHDMHLFRGVVWGDTGEADYVLTGDLTFFYGRQAAALTSRQEFTAGFLGGLIGAGIALAGAQNSQTNGEVLIQLQNVALRDPSGRVVAQLGTVSEYYLGYLQGGSCEVIYEHVDSRLPIFAHALAQAVYDAFVTPEESTPLPEPRVPDLEKPSTNADAGAEPTPDATAPECDLDAGREPDNPTD